MIAQLAGLAIDARVATRRAMQSGGDPVARAAAARWIAANALAARGVRVALEGALPHEPTMFALPGDGFAAMIAALAALPMLVDGAGLPRRWRLALCALGMPMLDRPAPVALAHGASVLGPAGAAGAAGAGCRELAVAVESQRYRVRIAPPDRMLVA